MCNIHSLPLVFENLRCWAPHCLGCGPKLIWRTTYWRGRVCWSSSHGHFKLQNLAQIGFNLSSIQVGVSVLFMLTTNNKTITIITIFYLISCLNNMMAVWFCYRMVHLGWKNDQVYPMIKERRNRPSLAFEGCDQLWLLHHSDTQRYLVIWLSQ